MALNKGVPIQMGNKKQYRHKISIIKDLRMNKSFYAMMLPGFLFIVIFNYLPMMGILIAFQDYNPVKGIFGSEWIGLKNFEFFFKSDAMATVTFNTIFNNIIIMLAVTILSLLFSILMHETGNRWLTSSYKSVMLLPYFLSWIVFEYMLYALLNVDQGIVNGFLTSLGLEPIQWYSEPVYWRFIIPLAYILKSVGYTSVIYVAAITGISKEYYEAAEIDGANKLHMARYITIPLLMPVVITLLLLSVGKIFNGGLGDWGAFFSLPRESGVLFSTTDVIDTYVFRMLRTVSDLGMSSAVGLYQSVVGLVLVLLSNYLIKRYDRDSSLF